MTKASNHMDDLKCKSVHDSPQEVERIIANWASHDKANDTELFGIEKEIKTSGHKWQGVYANSDTCLALYEVRDVPTDVADPNYHKSLKLYFAPEVSLVDIDGIEGDALECLLDKVTKILAHAFMARVEQAQGTQQRKCKIHASHPLEFVIYREFAKRLNELQPDKFKCKVYKTWVEIKWEVSE